MTLSISVSLAKTSARSSHSLWRASKPSAFEAASRMANARSFERPPRDLILASGETKKMKKKKMKKMMKKMKMMMMMMMMMKMMMRRRRRR
jgi:hypothetical protein